MKTNLIQLILLSTFMFNSYAQVKEHKGKPLKSVRIEATDYLKKNISHDLQQSVGLKEFALKLDLEIDEKKLQEILGSPIENTNKLKGYDLPGLFVDGSDRYRHSIFREASKEDVILALKGVKIQLLYYEDHYTHEFMQDSLLKMVSYNLPLLNLAQIDIKVEKEAATYKSLIKSKEGKFLSFWNENFQTTTFAFLIGFFVLALLVAFSLKGGFGKVTEAIKNKTVGASSGANLQSNSPVKEQNSEYRGPVEADHFESYIQANSYLAEMVNKESKLCNEIILLKLIVADYMALTILFDVLPRDKREMFMANIDKEKRDAFKDYIVNQGSAFLKDEHRLKNEAVKMIKLIKVASLAPTDLYHIVMVNAASELKSHELKELMKAATIKEKAFLSEAMSPIQLAQMFQEDILGAQDLGGQNGELDKSETVDLIMKTGSFRHHNKSQTLSAKLIEVYAQIETNKGELLADSIGIEPSMRFDSLFQSNEKSALIYLESLDFSKLSSLFPLLTAKMQEKALISLPELLAERLKFANKNISSEGLTIKGEFYFYLRSLSQSENRLNIFDASAA